jgi:hypothetical protein
VALQSLSQETLGGRQIASLAEPKFNGIAVAVDGTTEILPLASNFDVSLVEVLFASDGFLALVEALQQLG